MFCRGFYQGVILLKSAAEYEFVILEVLLYCHYYSLCIVVYSVTELMMAIWCRVRPFCMISRRMMVTTLGGEENSRIHTKPAIGGRKRLLLLAVIYQY